jgi:hypothetical protein
MNAHATPEPAAPLDVADLEDLVCRVHWMALIAWDALTFSDGGRSPDDETKVFHLVRAANELALELYEDYYKVLSGGTALRGTVQQTVQHPCPKPLFSA